MGLDSVGLFVLECGVKSSLILLLVFGVTKLLARKFSSDFRYAFWRIGFLAASVMPFLVALLPALELPILTATRPETLGSALVTPATEISVTPFDPVYVALSVYLIVVAALCVRLWTGWLSNKRLRTASACCTPETQAMAIRLAQGMQLQRPFIIMNNHLLRSPMTFGVLRPVVLLPMDSESWPKEKLRGAITHELNHIRRLDWPVMVLSRLLCILNWYNPLFWRAFERLNEECERSCDDAALAIGVTPSSYAEQLVNLAKQQINYGHALGMASNRPFADRVRAILNPTIRRDKMSRIQVLTSSVMAVIVVVPLAACQAVADSAMAERNSSSTPLADPAPVAAEAPAPAAEPGEPSTIVAPPAAAQPPLPAKLQQEREELRIHREAIEREREVLRQHRREIEIHREEHERHRVQIEREREALEAEREQIEKERQIIEREIQTESERISRLSHEALIQYEKEMERALEQLHEN